MMQYYFSGPEILKIGYDYLQMDFFPTKQAVGRLMSFLITGNFPNDGDALEDILMAIGKHSDQKPYFT